MSSIRLWDTTANNNQGAAPDGFPEGMARSGVNDASREVMARVREFYDDPSWVEPWNVPGSDRTYQYVGAKSFRVLGDVTGYLEVGHLLKITYSGNVWVGIVSSRTYIGAFAISQIDISEYISDLSQDTTGPAGLPTIIAWRGDAYDASMRATGTSSGQVPLIDDLESHVTKAESTLDVGSVDGLTPTEIAETASRNLLYNGEMLMWQRSVFDPMDALEYELTADTWVSLQDNGGATTTSMCQVIRDTDVPTSTEQFRYSMKLTVQNTNPNNYKSGVMSVIEDRDGYMVGGPNATQGCSVSLWAKSNGGIGQARVYLFNLKTAPTGAVNDPITDYKSGTGNVAVDWDTTDWELVNSAPITLTTSWTRFVPFEDQSMNPTNSGSGYFGIAIIMDDASFVDGDTMHLTGVQVVAAEKAPTFRYKGVSATALECKRYYEKSMEEGSRPRDGHASIGYASASLQSWVDSGNATAQWFFEAEKFPTNNVTQTLYNPENSSPGSNYFHQRPSATDLAVNATRYSPKHLKLKCTTGTDGQEVYISAAVAADIYGINP